MMKRAILLLIPVSFLFRCGQTSVPAPEIQDRKPHSGPADYHFTDAFPDTIEFEQGYNRKIDLGSLASVPSPGNPIVTVENLPAGATFDGKTLSWTPACGASALPFQADIAEFSVRFTLSSDDVGDEYIQRRVNLRVHRFFEGPGRTCGDPMWRRDGFALDNPGVYFDQNFQTEISFFQGASTSVDLLPTIHSVPVEAVNLTIEGLPADAQFNGQSLSWTPSCKDNANLYVNRKRIVKVQVKAAKASDPNQFAKTEVSLIVHQMTPCGN